MAASFVANHPSAYPNGMRLTVRPLGEVVTRDVKPVVMALGAAVGFVLLIACVNVANLFLARAKTRDRELAVRRALGATRLRLMRQLLAENLVVAILGGAWGLLARLGIGVLDWLRPEHLPRQSEIAIDGVVMLWIAGLTLMSSAIFGLVPALTFTRRARSAAPLEPRGVAHAAQPEPASSPRLVRDRDAIARVRELPDVDAARVDPATALRAE